MVKGVEGMVRVGEDAGFVQFGGDGGMTLLLTIFL